MALKNISLESHRRPGRAIGSSTITPVRGQHGYNQVYLWFVTQEDNYGGTFLFVSRRFQPACQHFVNPPARIRRQGRSRVRRNVRRKDLRQPAVGSPISAKIRARLV